MIAYAVNYPDLYFKLASFIDRIFKGARPGDLPIQQPMKIDLVINRKTANALGLAISHELRMQATRVIE